MTFYITGILYANAVPYKWRFETAVTGNSSINGGFAIAMFGFLTGG
jgi:hypothetical protein